MVCPPCLIKDHTAALSASQVALHPSGYSLPHCWATVHFAKLAAPSPSQFPCLQPTSLQSTLLQLSNPNPTISLPSLKLLYSPLCSLMRKFKLINTLPRPLCDVSHLPTPRCPTSLPNIADTHTGCTSGPCSASSPGLAPLLPVLWTGRGRCLQETSLTCFHWRSLRLGQGLPLHLLA